MKQWHKIKSRHLARAGVIAALAAGGVAGGVSVASAATTHTAAHTAAAPPGAGGVVTAVSGDSLTVETPASTSVTYTLTSATVVDEGWATADAAALAVGERVAVQVASASSTTATTVVIQEPTIVGEVVSVSSDTIVLKDQDGFYRTVDVSDATTYLDGTTTSSASAVTVGATIAVEGTVGADHTTLDATSVQLGRLTPPAGAPLPPNGFGAPGGASGPRAMAPASMTRP